MKKISVLATSALLLASLFTAGPSTAIEHSPKAPDAPADAPAYDPKVAAPKPGDLTWAEVATQTTSLYKTVWWGLQRVAGPFNSFNQGQASLTQTSPEVVCADLRDTTFRMFVRSTGTFPTGALGSASAWEGATLRCGTN